MNTAQETVKILFDTQCIRFAPDKPFTLTSGRFSPVYVDCRRLISFVEERRKIIQFWKEILKKQYHGSPFDCIVGGETAGIPFAAFLAESLDKPMAYVRKSPKGFGRNASIEGNLQPNTRALLVEDLSTDGGSKVKFIETLRHARIEVNHCFVVFAYGIFSGANPLDQIGVRLHALATWSDVMEYARKHHYFTTGVLDEVQRFLDAPEQWAPEKTKCQNFE